MVKPSNRQKLIRVAVSEMSQLHNNPYHHNVHLYIILYIDLMQQNYLLCRYPTSQIKKQLAKDIILTFLKLHSMLTTGDYVLHC